MEQKSTKIKHILGLLCLTEFSWIAKSYNLDFYWHIDKNEKNCDVAQQVD